MDRCSIVRSALGARRSAPLAHEVYELDELTTARKVEPCGVGGIRLHRNSTARSYRRIESHWEEPARLAHL